MQNLKILIVEDEPLIAHDIQSLLTDWGYQVVGCASTSQDAIEMFEKHQPDIALVDVQLYGTIDGIETVKQFNLSRRIPIIYLTAQADFQTVERAKTTAPSAYLLKPFDERHLHISLELALSNFSQNTHSSHETAKQTQGEDEKEVVFAHEVKLSADVILKQGDAIFIKQNYRFVKLKVEDLVYIEADRNHSYLVMTHQKFIVRMPLTLVVERINDPQLIRVHRSFAINQRHVEAFDDTEIMVNGKTVPFTNAYRDDFLKNFNVV